MTIADLDRQLVGVRGDEHVWVELESATHLAHETLLYLVGYFHHRTHHNLRTSLSLPRSDTAIDFLRAWGLPGALQEVTNERFEYLLDADSRARFEALPRFSRYEKVIFTPGAGREALLPKTFFALTPLNIPQQSVSPHIRTSPQRAASLERDRWLQAHVLNVLNFYLGRGDDVATRVVYEAVLNAARHPKAGLGFVSSQLVRSQEGSSFGAPTAIEIAIWDNGMSFAETLGARVRDGLPIHAESFGRINEEFDVWVQGRGNQTSSRVTLASHTRINTADPDALTVAAFMLGVTSDPERGTTLDDELFGSGAPDPAGSGLYYIRRTVVDKFNGSIRYITGNSRMEIRGAGERGRYHAVVRTNPDATADVSGNLLIVTIPVEAAGIKLRSPATAAVAR